MHAAAIQRYVTRHCILQMHLFYVFRPAETRAQSSRKRPPSWTQSSRKRLSSWAQSSRKRPPAWAQSSRKRPPSWAQSSRKHPPSLAQSSRKRPPAWAQSSRKRPPRSWARCGRRRGQAAVARNAANRWKPTRDGWRPTGWASPTSAGRAEVSVCDVSYTMEANSDTVRWRVTAFHVLHLIYYSLLY